MKCDDPECKFYLPHEHPQCSSHSPLGEYCERVNGHSRPHRGEGAEWWSE